MTGFIARYVKGPARGVALGSLALAVALAVAWWSTSTAWAYQGHEATAVAAAPLQQDQVREPEANLPFLFAVFFITWAAFFAYVFIMSRRQRELRREIEELRQALAEREAASTHGDR